MKNKIDTYLDSLQNQIEQLNRTEIENFAKVLLQARKEGRNIFFLGNDHSATIASKFCRVLNKDLSSQENERFKAFCLNDNMKALLEYAEDGNFDNVFIDQLSNLYQSGDIVVGISKDGNCDNVIKAIEYANNHNGFTIALTGLNGGTLQQITNLCINADVNDTKICDTILMLLCNTVYSALKN